MAGTRTSQSSQPYRGAPIGAVRIVWVAVALCATQLSGCSWLRSLASPLEKPANVAASGGGAPAATNVAALALGFDGKLLAKGFQPELRGNVQLYCRTEVPTGTRFSRKACFTAEQLDENAKTARDMLDPDERVYGSRCISNCRRY